MSLAIIATAVGMVLGVLGLLGTMFTFTWKSASITTKLTTALDTQNTRNEEMRVELEQLKAIPQLAADVEHLKKNHSLIPKLAAEVEVLKAKAEFSKEMRAVMRRSRPDTEE